MNRIIIVRKKKNALHYYSNDTKLAKKNRTSYIKYKTAKTDVTETKSATKVHNKFLKHNTI